MERNSKTIIGIDRKNQREIPQRAWANNPTHLVVLCNSSKTIEYGVEEP
jgi:hypothetical protein